MSLFKDDFRQQYALFRQAYTPRQCTHGRTRPATVEGTAMTLWLKTLGLAVGGEKAASEWTDDISYFLFVSEEEQAHG